jgi:DNA-binding NarL/FixJ family response regulator
LPDAIRGVMKGEPPMSPGIARMIIAGMQQTTAAATPAVNDYGLSNREKEILTRLATGKGIKLIASDLFISVETVRTHLKKVYEKLQVHTQVEVVSKAINERLV